jgi:hypothetical protein
LLAIGAGNGAFAGDASTRRLPDPLFEPSGPLQDLDLVAVRILDEEKPRDQRPVALELDNVARRKPERADAVMLGVEIGDRDREMAVAVAELIGLLAPLVDGQFKLERAVVIGHVDQRETVEVEPVGDLQPERLVVKVDGTGLFENPDHGMNRLRQMLLPR